MVFGLWPCCPHWDSSRVENPPSPEEAVVIKRKAIDLIGPPPRSPSTSPLWRLNESHYASDAADLSRWRRSPSVAAFKRRSLIVRIMRAAAAITTTLGRINRLLSLTSTPAPVVSHSITVPRADSCHFGAQLITRIVSRQLRKTTRCGCHCIDRRN